MATINMPRHRLQALLLLLRRTLEILPPMVIDDLFQDKQWRFYYKIASDSIYNADKPENKPN